jgi:sulfur relay (sulfurtransferase) complex TusBCD TusD component (DsrE family)
MDKVLYVTEHNAGATCRDKTECVIATVATFLQFLKLSKLSSSSTDVNVATCNTAVQRRGGIKKQTRTSDKHTYLCFVGSFLLLSKSKLNKLVE